jgi:hypothetical protein
MFKLDEIRAQLQKYPNDVECVNLLRELDDHFGYNLSDPSVQGEFLKLQGEVQLIYSSKDGVQKQQALIEASKRAKAFMTNIKNSPVLSEETKRGVIEKVQSMMVGIVESVLGIKLEKL